MTHRRTALGAALAASAVLLTAGPAGAAAGAKTVLITPAVHGGLSHGVLINAAVDGTGAVVAFSTSAEDVFPGVQGGRSQAYVRDTRTGTVDWISRTPSGGRPDGDSSVIDISSSGRYVLLDSDADDLVAGDANGSNDVFRFDRMTGRTILVSLAVGGGQFRYGAAPGRLSPDGRFATFTGISVDPRPSSTGRVRRQRDAYVRDLQTGVTTRVSVGTGGDRIDGQNDAGAVSADGSIVLFRGDIGGSGEGQGSAWVRDLRSGTTTRLSVDRNGRNVYGYPVDLSDDGQLVLFQAHGDLLRAGVTSSLQAYVQNLRTGLVRYAATDHQGRPLSYTDVAALSADGRYIAFETGDPGLVSTARAAYRDVFLRDVVTGAVRRVDIGLPFHGQGASNLVGISADGSAVLFISGPGRAPSSSAQQYLLRTGL